MNLNTSVMELSGIGEKRAKLYEKLGIYTLFDLITHYPRGYIDFSSPVPIINVPANEHAVVQGVVIKKIPAAKIRQGLVLYKVILEDDSDRLTVVIYNNRFAYDVFEENEKYILSGKVTGNFTRKEMNSPQVIKATDENKLRPVYPLTEGLTNNMLITNIGQAVLAVDGQIEDFLPNETRLDNSLCTLEYAVKNIHFPENDHAADIAKKRLSFDELLKLQLGMLLLKGRNRLVSGCKMTDNNAMQKLFQSLSV